MRSKYVSKFKLLHLESIKYMQTLQISNFKIQTNLKDKLKGVLFSRPLLRPRLFIDNLRVESGESQDAPDTKEANNAYNEARWRVFDSLNEWSIASGTFLSQ